MPDNFYTLDPVDQQIALAYAQGKFCDWLSQNRHADFPARKAEFLTCLEEGISVALDLCHR